MSPKRIQLLFFVGICAITLHFTVRLAIDCASYFSLRSSAKALVEQWETVPVKDRFALKATYSFRAQEKTWRGETVFRPPYYLNEGAAFEALKIKAKEPGSAWYHPDNPARSSLEKPFPVGLLVRALICYGVVVYFFSLYKRLVLV